MLMLVLVLLMLVLLMLVLMFVLLTNARSSVGRAGGGTYRPATSHDSGNLATPLRTPNSASPVQVRHICRYGKALAVESRIP